MRCNILIVLILEIFKVFNQAQLYVLSKEDGKAIAFATLVFTESKRAYLSDESDVFQILSYNQDQAFSIQHISHKSSDFSFQTSTNTVFLIKKTYQITSFDLIATAPIELVENAIKALPKN
jgi:hypothetical protein